MKPTLIYIGANKLQGPAIAWAKAAGLRVIVTDANPNAANISLADGYEQISGDDVQGIVALARDVQAHGKLAGCYCGSDFGLGSVSAVGAVCGVPAPTQEAVARALDKVSAASILRENGISVPQGGQVGTFEELQIWADVLGYPLIVKPVDSSGSRGVKTVFDIALLRDAFENASRFSNSIMVERVVEGEHIDVNGMFVDDVFYPCGLLSRYFSPPPFNYPLWGCEPCVLDEVSCACVYQTIEAAARVLGIANGPVKADVVFSSNGQPVILEISPRFHGDVSTSFVTPLVTKKSAPQAWFAYLAGCPFVELIPRDIPSNVSMGSQEIVAGWMGIFPQTTGHFERLDGIEEAKKIPFISDIMTLKKTGFYVNEVADNLAVLGFIWGTGRDRMDLFENLTKARSKIDVIMQK